MPVSLSLDSECEYSAAGRRVFGVDEVGRGPLAGPVVAACVGFGVVETHSMRLLQTVIVNDSKKLTREQRKEAVRVIREVAAYVEVGVVAASVIDEINILQATFAAMREATKGAQMDQSTIFLVDGNQKIPNFGGHQETVIGGDGKVFSIAAASIVAKEFRDTLMEGLEAVYQGYGFAKHKGYGTKEHYAAIAKLGLCLEHRRTFCR